MVGIVIVSHSRNLADSVVEFTGLMAADAKIAAAGGMEDGSFGTSFEKIQKAVESVYSEDGVIILMDMGSAVMTTEMVIEMFDPEKVKMADCPLVEGAVVATIDAVSGMKLEEITEALKAVGSTRNFDGAQSVHWLRKAEVCWYEEGNDEKDKTDGSGSYGWGHACGGRYRLCGKAGPKRSL